ncbi:hypothetical protein ACINLE_16175 [Bacillus sp. z60-18]|uniref:hypothetical protein n=2 Tax=Bacillus TaxID=1386 RepID=UPI00390C8801
MRGFVDTLAPLFQGFDFKESVKNMVQFLTEVLLNIANIIPDAARLIIKEEISNLNILFIPSMKSVHKTYMVIAFSANILNHLGIASQAFKRSVENLPILFLLIIFLIFYQNNIVKFSTLHALPFDFSLGMFFNPKKHKCAEIKKYQGV